MIYLDNAATSYPKAPGVIDCLSDFMRETGANAGRSSYRLARESSRIMYQARKNLSRLLNVSNAECISFTMNTTHSLNIAIKGMLSSGMTVLTSSIEHNSVMRPLRYLESIGKVKVLQFGMQGFEPDWEDLIAKLDSKPDLFVFTAASNVFGIVMPFEKMNVEAKKRGIPVILDAAQALGTIPIDASQFDIVCFPGHKGLLGPMGTGGIYVSENIRIAPLMQGGTGSRSSEEFQPEEMPDRLESGTQNIPGIAGLNRAVRFLLERGVSEIASHKHTLTKALSAGLKEIPEISIHSPESIEQNCGVISITSQKYSISELTYSLDKADIAVRMGLHCAPAAHKTYATYDCGGTVRFSPGFSTTVEEIERTLEIIREKHSGK